MEQILTVKQRSINIKKWFPFTSYDLNDENHEKVICIHHAGGSAAHYRGWAMQKGDKNFLCAELPGKNTRMTEKYLDNADELIEKLGRVLFETVGENYILYGHSMGAAIAFYLAYFMDKNYGKAPRALVVAGRQAPDDIDQDEFHSDMNDEALICEMRRYGGMPEEILQNKELLDFFLPMIRKDYELNDTITYNGEIINCPIYAYAGSNDKGASADIMQKWNRMTTGDFYIREIEGGHFFVTDEKINFKGILESI